MTHQNREATKIPYRTPKLTAYGDVRTITRTNANDGDSDALGPFAKKTGIVT